MKTNDVKMKGDTVEFFFGPTTSQPWRSSKDMESKEGKEKGDCVINVEGRKEI